MVFEQNMDSNLYHEILVFDFFPFMAAHFDFDCVLHQDNDAKHGSKLCRDILKNNQIKWVCIIYILIIFIWEKFPYLFLSWFHLHTPLTLTQ